MDHTGIMMRSDETESNNDDPRAEREAANSTTSFMRLPPEIRNVIYYQVLPFDLVLRYRGLGRSNLYTTAKIGLLYTCRAIRKEAGPIFFGNSILAISFQMPHMHEQALCFFSGLPQEFIASLPSMKFLRGAEYSYKHSESFTCQSYVHVALGDSEAPSNPGTPYHTDVEWVIPSCTVCQEEHKREPHTRLNAAVGRIAETCAKRNLHREDILELLHILRPVNSPLRAYEEYLDREGVPRCIGQGVDPW